MDLGSTERERKNCAKVATCLTRAPDWNYMYVMPRYEIIIAYIYYTHNLEYIYDGKFTYTTCVRNN